MTASRLRGGAPVEDGDDLDVEEALALVREAKDDGTGPAPVPGTRDARTDGPHRAASWPEAREIAARAARTARSAGTRRGPVSVPLGDSLGLVLAAPLDALGDLPSFDTSAMDGWAVAGPGPWTVREEGVLAGHAQPAPLTDGEAVPIATGARVPADTTAVLRTEHGRTDTQGRLHATRDLAHGQDIRPRGQECRSGDQLLPVGTLITPAVLGLAAAAGYDTVTVVPRPRVEVLVLGDELLTEGLPHDGLIRDALGPMLPPWLRALGAEVVAVRRVRDDARALRKAITASSADLIVTTGGTAAGPVDHVHPTLERIGAELLVDGVAVRPGHPMLLARLQDGRHLVGLPGNPLAAVSGLLTLAEPLLRTLAAHPAPEPYALPLTEAVHGHPYDTRLVPVVLRGDRAVPLHYNGPAMLRGVAAADALAVVPPGGARPGEEAELLDLPWAVAGIGVCFT
ncbi:molybdopterin molybdotransferase MoeA [Streptomyces sp. NEAU-sy36]|uniref:molybdopterin molybdotransferase MoeA n=1 Tax=unclassified Streptomyces TaxID=2593676 RepID=UPI0015D576E1|nr:MULTISPECIES: molybdopterin molybdotransferase MoeA [unclassified Streptomyces]QLI99568.1 molybdopterin molybdotransferase MoeA [Streptomyces sp. NEAU-sy36]QLJ06043.1 molybdopterin molybdotransferase MoeA [Streptomyces sp. NEAU-sy36]